MHLECLLTLLNMDIELIYLNGFSQIKLRLGPIKFKLVNSDWKESIFNQIIWRTFDACFDNNHLNVCLTFSEQ